MKILKHCEICHGEPDKELTRHFAKLIRNERTFCTACWDIINQGKKDDEILNLMFCVKCSIILPKMYRTMLQRICPSCIGLKETNEKYL